MIDCAACGDKIGQDFKDGAIILAPPDDRGLSERIHLCNKCWKYHHLMIKFARTSGDD